MRRGITLSIALILGVTLAFGITPGLLAKQGVILDEDPNFEDIIVNCGDGELCPDLEGFQTYDVLFLDAAYVPELTYTEAMVVMVVQGELAFRVQSDDVIIDPQGAEGEARGNELALLHTDVPVEFGEPPRDASRQPVYSDAGIFSDSDCSRPTVQDLCLLSPEQFADQTTFVKLVPGNIVYLPAGSTCFFCNVTSTGDLEARVVVWTQGSDFSWYVQSLADNPTPSAHRQELHDVQGWMFNPGSRCH